MAVFESFESISSGVPTDLTWMWGDKPDTTEASTSHVTQGTYSFKCAHGAETNSYSMSTFGLDLTGATLVGLDIYIVGLGTGDTIILQITGPGKSDSVNDIFTGPTTGAATLSCDISSFSAVNSVTLQIFISNISSGEAFEVYFDNLSDDPQPPPESNIKTWDGLADASVKTANGLARASVKSKNGLQ